MSSWCFGSSDAGSGNLFVYIKEYLERYDVVMLAGSGVSGTLIDIPKESHSHHTLVCTFWPGQAGY